MQARWGTHGDHPIIVLAVATTRECFDLTVKAFNLSEKYRTPVILLTDEVVAHTREKLMLPRPGTLEVVDRVRPTAPPEWYMPYEDTARGVPPMGIFGDGYRYHVTGLIHDVHGFPTERPDEIVPFMNRLFRKITQHFDDILMVEKELTEDAEILVVAYGSVARTRPAGRSRGEGAGHQGRAAATGHPVALSPAASDAAAAPGPGRPGAGAEYGPDVPGSQTGQPGYDPGGDLKPD